MKKNLFKLFVLLFIGVFTFSACDKEEEDKDTCSNELGDVGPDYGCDVAVYPEICTVDGVDHHWILNGEEYACDNGDCTTPPQALVEAIEALDGCASKKSIDYSAVNVKISKKAERIIAKLKQEHILCSN